MQLVTLRGLKTETHPETKRLFWFLFAGTRGGSNRIRIMEHLRDTPRNANQLACDLGIDYKGIQHHLKTLENSNLITKMGENYGSIYFVSHLFEEGQQVFDEIVMKLTKTQ